VRRNQAVVVIVVLLFAGESTIVITGTFDGVVMGVVHGQPCAGGIPDCNHPMNGVPVSFSSAIQTVKVLTDRKGDYSVSLIPGIYSVNAGGSMYPQEQGPTQIMVIPRQSATVNFVVASNLL
jgi:hypothetical protein